MSKIIKKEKHPYKAKGLHLEFDNGHKYSVVNLGAGMTEVGEMYDRMGGRYEGILLPKDDKSDWGEPIRGSSIDEVVKFIEQEESPKGNR